MSLNRYEQMLFNYVDSNPDERVYWRSRVTELANSKRRREEAVLNLNQMLWEYFEERARFESPFREVAIHEGLQRISMLNLSERLLALWAPGTQGKARGKGS